MRQVGPPGLRVPVWVRQPAPTDVDLSQRIQLQPGLRPVGESDNDENTGPAAVEQYVQPE